jgi:hypothetical protein
MIEAYAGAIERIEGRSGLKRKIARAIGLTHVTWGLHLRLGPGLTALFGNYISDEEARRCAATDIEEGVQRALQYAASVGGI